MVDGRLSRLIIISVQRYGKLLYFLYFVIQLHDNHFCKEISWTFLDILNMEARGLGGLTSVLSRSSPLSGRGRRCGRWPRGRRRGWDSPPGLCSRAWHTTRRQTGGDSAVRWWPSQSQSQEDCNITISFIFSNCSFYVSSTFYIRLCRTLVKTLSFLAGSWCTEIQPRNWELYLPGRLMRNSFKWKRRCLCQASKIC